MTRKYQGHSLHVHGGVFSTDPYKIKPELRNDPTTSYG
jgi:hypothetical protein